MMSIPIEERVARLAAKLSPDEAADLLRSWDYHKTQHTDAELEALFASYRLERRELVRQELQRLYNLEAGDSEDHDSGSETKPCVVVRDSDNTNETKTVVTRIEEQIAQFAARNPVDAAELLDWWRWYKTAASDSEMEEFYQSHFGPKGEDE
ncbi:hypothetical protein [Edaphobacter aggregans]|uniref:hypothetical protein n=1 Tax=Edaphobacter aggregans TaxID=570835 RepID=UPI00055184B3|nr:hypothetical protein [Edaphobacter aggregans]